MAACCSVQCLWEGKPERGGETHRVAARGGQSMNFEHRIVGRHLFERAMLQLETRCPFVICHRTTSWTTSSNGTNSEELPTYISLCHPVLAKRLTSLR